MHEIGKKYITKREKWSFSIAALGQNMAYGIMSSFLLAFYTDIVFSDALWIVTIIMVVARIWDAINDPIMGSIVDRTRTKWGKCRPYLMAAPFPIAIFTILIFIAPNAALPFRIAYASFTYIMWGMLYTMSDVPFWGLPSTMTPNDKERADFLSFARILNGIGGALPFVVMELFKTPDGYTKYSYLYSAITMAVVGAALFSLAFFNTKERIIPQTEKLSIIDNLKLIRVNKPLVLVLFFGVIAFGRYFLNMCLVYATRDLYHNSPPNISMMLMSVALAVGMFPGMIIMPRLYKKYNYKQLAIAIGNIAFVFQVIFFLVSYLSGYNYYAALPLLFLVGIPFGMFNVLTFAIIGDSIDYMEWKTGKRTEGLGFACQTFMNKMGAAISAAIIPLLLIIIGYVAPDLRPIDYVNPSLGLLLVFSIVPALSMLLATIPMYKYDYIGEKKKEILAVLHQRRIDEGRLIEE